VDDDDDDDDDDNTDSMLQLNTWNTTTQIFMLSSSGLQYPVVLQ
jgi:hypothetical protein